MALATIEAQADTVVSARSELTLLSRFASLETCSLSDLLKGEPLSASAFEPATTAAAAAAASRAVASWPENASLLLPSHFSASWGWLRKICCGCLDEARMTASAVRDAAASSK